MQSRDKKNYLLNYDGHIHIIAHTSSDTTTRETVVLANRKKFNPNGDWLTPKAMYRWINLYVQKGNRGRITAWVDYMLVT